MAYKKRDNPVGRPPDFQPEFVEQAEKLCRLGATDMELADFFKVSWRTIYRWKNDHPKFGAALKVGKGEADDRVVRSLYQRAIGYEHDAVKIFMPANRKAPVIVDYVEHIAPDVNAATFWLKSRRPDEWREKTTLAIGGDADGVPLQHEVSALDQLCSSIARLAAASAASGNNEPDDGSDSGTASA